MGYLYISYLPDVWIKCNWVLALEIMPDPVINSKILQVKWYDNHVTTFYDLLACKVEDK